ncbi:MAG TPA: sodium:solute symporter family protein [Sandaracinaceae bacterium LLY-WYZ-13_1]|nr:sodium:solute symporter family protein [Sandaracinaceae bacterium LLY-WYZ-13_1]
MHWLDASILGAFLVFAAASGWSSAREASRGLVDYFLADRTLRGWQAGLSMAATQFAADTPLVVTGLVATAGVFAVWRFWVYAVAFLLMALVLGGPWRRAGVITDAQLAELRYHGRPAALLRGFKAVYLGVVFNCVVLAMVLLATTRLTEPFLTWHAWLPASVFDPIHHLVRELGVPLTASGTPCDAGACEVGACLRQVCLGPAQWRASTDNALSIGAILAVTTLYSSTGGLRSVVRTDLVQLALALAGTFAFAWIAVDRVGGLARLHEALADRAALTAFTPDRAPGVTPAFLGVLAVQWICQINADGSGYLAQRTMACRSDADARRAGVVFTLVQVLLRSLVWLPIGLSLLVLMPPPEGLDGAARVAEREASFVRGMVELLPPGVLGLMVTGMLGALASTVDTHLNWGASYVTNDLVGRFLMRDPRAPKSRRRLVWIARATNVAILTIALGVVPFLDSIRDAWQASLLLGAGVGVLLVLRWVWWRMNAWGELAALVTSAVLAPTLPWWVETDALRLLIVAGVATGAGISAALLTRPVPAERLRAFHERVRPPGFWGPVSDTPRADRRRLARGLAATAGAALGTFALLVGSGTWLLGAPPPTLLPATGPWIAVCLATGALLLPAALWLARRTT